MLKEPAGLKQVAKRLETSLQNTYGDNVVSVGTGYGLQSRLDSADKACWMLFVWSNNPDDVKTDPKFEGYPVQVRSAPVFRK